MSLEHGQTNSLQISASERIPAEGDSGSGAGSSSELSWVINVLSCRPTEPRDFSSGRGLAMV